MGCCGRHVKAAASQYKAASKKAAATSLRTQPRGNRGVPNPAPTAVEYDAKPQPVSAHDPLWSSKTQ